MTDIAIPRAAPLVWKKIVARIQFEQDNNPKHVSKEEQGVLAFPVVHFWEHFKGEKGKTHTS